MPDIGRKKRRQKGVNPSQELREAVAARLHELGVPAAVSASRIHREQLISVAAGVPVLEGTILRAAQWVGVAP